MIQLHRIALLALAALIGNTYLLALPRAEMASDSANNSSSVSKPSLKIGFSGGMLLHVGYMFSSSPDALFRNLSLKDLSNVTDLPRDGVALGLGGALRLHIGNHIHVGAEGGVSTMPLMRSGSSIRTGWGGALCDYCFGSGRIRPMIGGLIGGGTSRRLYVPSDGSSINAGDGSLTYNASYVNTPFFLLDPYIGMEIQLSSHSALVIKADYMLPFAKGDFGVAVKNGESPWSSFISPSGPRLYIGILFGRSKS